MLPDKQYNREEVVPTTIDETPERRKFDYVEINGLRAPFGLISHRLHRGSGSEGGLTRTKAPLLTSVANFNVISIRDVAGIEDLNPTMLSRMLGKFEDEGLLTRAPDTGDKRVVHVYITDADNDRFTRIRDRRIELLTEQLGELTPENLTALGYALGALEELAEGMRR